MKPPQISAHSPWILIAVFGAGVVVGNLWRFLPGSPSPSTDVPASRQPAPDHRPPGNAAGESPSNPPSPYPDLSGNTPPDLDTKWTDSMKNAGSEMELVTDLKGIAASMAAEGRAHEALVKTLETLGPGDSRCSVVRAIFQAARDIDSLGECFTLLEQDDEKDFAAQGLAERLTFESSPEEIDFRKFRYLGNRLDKMIATTVSTYIIQHSTTGQIAGSGVFEKSFSTALPLEARKSIIADIVSIVPFNCWNHVVNDGMDLSPAEQDRIVTEMVRIDPQAAIGKIRPASVAAASFKTAFTEWMKKDSIKPIEWINANSATLSEAQRDRAYQGIAGYAARQGDLATARQWAGMVTNAEVKDELA
ncbi:MAG: hypothetical protein EOP88_20600, partial [Verrucomicrobiaceae bacterium]